MTIAKRVVIGLSGGVDSAVSAYLLKKRGFDVTGVYMVNWDAQEESGAHCSRTKDEADARSVAERLDIPFRTVNFVREYWNEVFVDMIEGYRRGRTVVPDIACNRAIKFELLHRFAMEQCGADFVATGHYASTSRGDFQEIDASDDEGIKLLTGADPLKDQTYFLCTVKQSQLRRALFPLGSRMKTEVKRLAKEIGFDDLANKNESMGVCFIGKRKNFAEFMDEYIEPRKGVVRCVRSGAILGEHQGVHHFTLGKRFRKLEGVASALPPTHLGYFVAKMDYRTNEVFVCEGSHAACLYATSFLIRMPEWICRNPLDRELAVECRIQRTHPPIACRIEPHASEFLRVTPSHPLRAVAEGQMCVFYADRECFGGGEVERVLTTL